MRERPRNWIEKSRENISNFAWESLKGITGILLLAMIQMRMFSDRKIISKINCLINVEFLCMNDFDFCSVFESTKFWQYIFARLFITME